MKKASFFFLKHYAAIVAVIARIVLHVSFTRYYCWSKRSQFIEEDHNRGYLKKKVRLIFISKKLSVVLAFV